MITIIRVDFKEPNYYTCLEPRALDNIANSNHTHTHANTRTYSQTDTHTESVCQTDKRLKRPTVSRTDKQSDRQLQIHNTHSNSNTLKQSLFSFLFSLYISRFHLSISEQTNTVRRVFVVRHVNRYVTALLSDMITAM